MQFSEKDVWIPALAPVKEWKLRLKGTSDHPAQQAFSSLIDLGRFQTTAQGRAEHRTEENIILNTSLQKSFGGRVFELRASSATSFQISHLELIIPLQAEPPKQMFCNGWQSWSESRMYKPSERLPNLRWPFQRLLGPYGDDQIRPGHFKLGDLHSWSWTEWEIGSDPPESYLMGSLDENKAYTNFLLLKGSQTLSIRRDVPQNWPSQEDAQGRHGLRLFSLFAVTGIEDQRYDAWFAALGVKAPQAKAAWGWTSWYRYYTRISESTLLKELRALKPCDHGMEYFQIDDGWQEKIGDWLEVNHKFPDGMAAMATQIRYHGLKPGLWLAPFIAEKNSHLLRQHPEWAERDAKGRMLSAGYNPLWSGRFYALNPDNPALREHLRKVIRTITRDWGFELLKLDFLYAASIQHSQHQSRAQRMRIALEFLRESAGSCLLLGCGVPMAPAFGVLDYCRVGADVHLAWEHKLLAFLRNRERVSTKIALASTIGRRGLNGRAFLSDPDVFILRQGDAALKMNPEELRTVLLCNILFGSLHLCSDTLSEYEAKMMDWYRRAQSLLPLQLLSCRSLADRGYGVVFSTGQTQRAAPINLGERRLSTSLAQALSLSGGRAREEWTGHGEVLTYNSPIGLQAHASRLFVLE